MTIITKDFSQPQCEYLYKANPGAFDKVAISCQKGERLPDWLFPYLMNTKEVVFEGFEGSQFDNRLITQNVSVLSIERATWTIQDEAQLPSLQRLSLCQATVVGDLYKPFLIEDVDIFHSKISPDELLASLVVSAKKRLKISCIDSNDKYLEKLLETTLAQKHELVSLSLHDKSPSSTFYEKAVFPENIRVLNLSYSSISSQGIIHVMSLCAKLQQLTLRGIAPEIFPHNVQHRVLEELETDIQVFRQGIEYNLQTHLPNLKKLFLGEQVTATSSLSPLREFMDFIVFPEQLKSLKLCFSYITKPTLEYIFSQCQQLEEIWFGIYGSLEEIIPPLSLRRVDVSKKIADRTDLNIFSVVQLWKKAHNITSIGLRGRDYVSAPDLLPKYFPTTVTEARISAVVKKFLNPFFQSNKNLKNLVVINSPDLMEMPPFPSNLENLTIGPSVSKIPFTIEALKHILTCCRTLKFLAINATSFPVEQLLACDFPNTLERLHVCINGSQIDKEAFIDSLKSRIPKVHVRVHLDH